MNFDESVSYLLSLGHETVAIKLGLENVTRLLRRLGDPQSSFTSVQIAGTNGKGSTAAMLESICRAAGLRAGLYTSPHLVSITERVRVGGRDIPREEMNEVGDIFRAYGIAEEHVDAVVEAMAKEPRKWVDFMMRFEL